MGCFPSSARQSEDEELNRQARANAAEAAARRQLQYESTPHGRATKASIEKAKREKASATRSAGDGPSMRWQVG
jgi:hypothetical protein